MRREFYLDIGGSVFLDIGAGSFGVLDFGGEGGLSLPFIRPYKN